MILLSINLKQVYNALQSMGREISWTDSGDSSEIGISFKSDNDATIVCKFDEHRALTTILVEK